LIAASLGNDAFIKSFQNLFRLNYCVFWLATVLIMLYIRLSQTLIRFQTVERDKRQTKQTK